MSWNRLFQQHKQDPGESDCHGCFRSFPFYLCKKEIFLVEKLKKIIRNFSSDASKIRVQLFPFFPQWIGLLGTPHYPDA